MQRKLFEQGAWLIDWFPQRPRPIVLSLLRRLGSDPTELFSKASITVRSIISTSLVASPWAFFLADLASFAHRRASITRLRRSEMK